MARSSWFILEFQREIGAFGETEQFEKLIESNTSDELIRTGAFKDIVISYEKEINLRLADFYYTDEIKEGYKTLYVADGDGGGISPLLESGNELVGENLIVSESIDQLVEKCKENSSVPESLGIVKVALFDSDSIHIEAEDMGVFQGDECHGEQEVNGKGLCEWLSEWLGYVTVYISANSDEIVASKVWSYGQDEEEDEHFELIMQEEVKNTFGL